MYHPLARAGAYVAGRLHGRSKPELTDDDLFVLQARGRAAANDESLPDEARSAGATLWHAALWHAATAAIGKRGATAAERAAGLAVCRKAVRS